MFFLVKELVSVHSNTECPDIGPSGQAGFDTDATPHTRTSPLLTTGELQAAAEVSPPATRSPKSLTRGRLSIDLV